MQLKLNRTGRTLLSRSTTGLPVEVQAQVRERKGGTLRAVFDTVLHR